MWWRPFLGCCKCRWFVVLKMWKSSIQSLYSSLSYLMKDWRHSHKHDLKSLGPSESRFFHLGSYMGKDIDIAPLKKRKQNYSKWMLFVQRRGRNCWSHCAMTTYYALFRIEWVMYSPIRDALLSWHGSFVGKKWQKAWKTIRNEENDASLWSQALFLKGKLFQVWSHKIRILSSSYDFIPFLLWFSVLFCWLT